MTPSLFPRRSGAILGVLAVSALLAACGSSSSSSANASGSSTSTTTASAAAAAGAGSARGAALRACLKAHGVTLPNRRPGTGRPPGATPGGGLFGGGGRGGGRFAANPKLRAALQACGARFGFRGGAGRFRPSTQRVSAFVACVRKHGYAMPSPNLSGTGPLFPASIRTNPKFLAAAKPCESLLVPPGGPAGPPGTSTTA